MDASEKYFSRARTKKEFEKISFSPSNSFRSKPIFGEDDFNENCSDEVDNSSGDDDGHDNDDDNDDDDEGEYRTVRPQVSRRFSSVLIKRRSRADFRIYESNPILNDSESFFLFKTTNLFSAGFYFCQLGHW